MHLNREQRHRRKMMIKRGQYSRQHSLRGKTLPQSGVWNRRSSHTAQLQLYYGNGTALCKGVDPTSAMQNADVKLIHSSLIILSQATSLHQASARALSGSYQDAGLGHQTRLHTGSLAHCLKCLTSDKWAIQQGPVWVLITFLQKNNKALVRSLDYSSLLHIAKHTSCLTSI